MGGEEVGGEEVGGGGEEVGSEEVGTCTVRYSKYNIVFTIIQYRIGISERGISNRYLDLGVLRKLSLVKRVLHLDISTLWVVFSTADC